MSRSIRISSAHPQGNDEQLTITAGLTATDNPRLDIIPAIAKKSPTRSRRTAGSQAAQKTDARLGRIVRVLMDHAMVMVSGTKIGEEIGTGRSEVWRLIQQLRSLGVEVEGHPATGYQLRAVPDLLLADVIGPLVQRTLFTQIHPYSTLGPTNDAPTDRDA